MRASTKILKETGLFEGIEDDEIETMLNCLGAHRARYSKDEFIFRRGDSTDSVGVVLGGNVRMIREDWWGRRTVLGDVRQGQVLGTEYACAHGRPLDVSMTATEPTEVLFLDIGRAANVCTSSCEFHNRLVRNLISVLAHDSLSLNQRLDQISKRSTRDKICAFLSDQSRRAGSNEFYITFNRQEMADYLGVDRSAMSNELSKMQRDGLLEYEKNHFILK